MRQWRRLSSSLLVLSGLCVELSERLSDRCQPVDDRLHDGIDCSDIFWFVWSNRELGHSGGGFTEASGHTS